jgi:alanyl-tRNA synthetase
MNSSAIRKAFIEYFSQRSHQAVPSSSLIPLGDATLLFTNAGMVQFKDTFLGVENRSYSKAVSSQRCVRAGGKHNDLENVGYTARHHTFFEMLGNFSFGDYFKREAITYAWEFLTKILKLPPERLWITVFTDDDEAAQIWLNEIGISSERFSRCGEKDNFWSMGDTGPCGPCTEIFYDHGADIAGGPPGSPDADGDRYIEIWNLVFMQFNRDKEGKLHPLPKPSVDTGMGLERIAAVVQGVHNNYDIDLFQHLIKAIRSFSDNEDKDHPSLKVVADHIRACAFLISDGVIPGNEGRGYVLRRIIRRAVRHGNKLYINSPFFYRLVTPLIEVMGEAYPELQENQANIERILQQEENQFAKTLEQGLRLLHEEIQGLKGKEIPGSIAFKLYDTYGFPIDLTGDIAREQELTIDIAGFEQCMQQQRQQSQSASQFAIDYHVTLQLSDSSEFEGYELNSTQSKVLSLLTDGNKAQALKHGQAGGMVLQNTPFYAESGGQVGDKGYWQAGGAYFQVEDTQKVGKAIVHYGHVVKGQINLGDVLIGHVDVERREAIRINHTATHLLHAALKQILGTHVQQKGSLVDYERARFDFSHFEALTPEQTISLEKIVNQKIRENAPAVTEVMDIEEAKKSGAVALFGEKYSDSVRVLSLGDFSKELCGGTHAKRTGDIGLFKIVAEYGIASGVRRIELVTGEFALTWVNEQLATLSELAQQLRCVTQHSPDKLAQLLSENKSKEKEIHRLQAKLSSQSSNEFLKEVRKIGDIELLVKRVDDDGQGLRALLDQLKSSIQSGIIVLYSLNQDKVNIVAGVSKGLIGKVPGAAQLVRHLCGKGGGRDDMAQGGGPIPENFSEKLAQLDSLIAEDAT